MSKMRFISDFYRPNSWGRLQNTPTQSIAVQSLLEDLRDSDIALGPHLEEKTWFFPISVCPNQSHTTLDPMPRMA